LPLELQGGQPTLEEKITIDSERRVENPVRPGAEAVVQVAKYAGGAGCRGETKKIS
jgi:hypothetical protein